MKTIIGIEKFRTLFIAIGVVWGAMMMWIPIIILDAGLYACLLR